MAGSSEESKLTRERERGKLFWVDLNVVRLFRRWMESPRGRAFEYAVHCCYWKLRIPPLRQSLIREFEHFAASKCSGSRVTIDQQIRYDIWEAVAAERFDSLGACFVSLALDATRVLGLLTESDTEPIAPKWEATFCFWNRPALNKLLRRFQYDLVDGAGDLASMDQHAIAAAERGTKAFEQLKGDSTSRSQLELDQHCDAFDVTELVCQLFYSWLLVTKRGQETEMARYKLIRYLCSREVEDGAPLGVDEECWASMTPFYPALALILNSNSPRHMKRITPTGLEQLEAWLSFRVGGLTHGDNLVAPLKPSVSARIIRKLVADVKGAAGVEQPDVNPLATTLSTAFSRLLAKVDAHRFILELGIETAALGRVFRWWLRCPGGREKQRVMVEKMNEGYGRMGWPPCKNSSLLQEMRSKLSGGCGGGQLSQEAYHIWLSSVPESICGTSKSHLLWELMTSGPEPSIGSRVCDSRSFVNFVAAVSHEEEFEEFGEPEWALVERVRFHAAAGGYLLLKPLPGWGEANAAVDTGGVNELALFCVEELMFWRRWELLWSQYPAESDEFDAVVTDLCPRDFARDHSAHLSDGSREAVERRLTNPTLALCRDVTGPVVRVVSECFAGCPRDVAEALAREFGLEAMKSLLFCRRIHTRATATQHDFHLCLHAAALLTGECEVGGLVAGLARRRPAPLRFSMQNGWQEATQELRNLKLGDSPVSNHGECSKFYPISVPVG